MDIDWGFIIAAIIITFAVFVVITLSVGILMYLDAYIQTGMPIQHIVQ